MKTMKKRQILVKYTVVMEAFQAKIRNMLRNEPNSVPTTYLSVLFNLFFTVLDGRR